MAGVAEKSGPPRNRNAAKHYVHSYLAQGRLPKGASYTTRLMYEFRHQLEAVVSQKHGEVTLFHAALIQTAIRHESRAQLLQRWLRTEEGLTLAERVTLLQQIGAASDSRDKCLEKMGLNGKAEALDILAVIRDAHRDQQTAGNRLGSNGGGKDDPGIEQGSNDASGDAPALGNVNGDNEK